MDAAMRVRREEFPIHYHAELPEFAILELSPTCLIPVGLQTLLTKPGLYYLPFHAYSDTGEEPLRAYRTLEDAFACVERVYRLNRLRGGG